MIERHVCQTIGGSRLLCGRLINYQTMEHASLAYMALKLKKLTIVAVTQFLKMELNTYSISIM